MLFLVTVFSTKYYYAGDNSYSQYPLNMIMQYKYRKRKCDKQLIKMLEIMKRISGNSQVISQTTLYSIKPNACFFLFLLSLFLLQIKFRARGGSSISRHAVNHQPQQGFKLGLQIVHRYHMRKINQVSQPPYACLLFFNYLIKWTIPQSLL